MRIRRTAITFVLAVGTMAGLTVSTAGAQNGIASNGPTDAAVESNCGFGSCFSPSFSARGEAVVYKGPRAGRVEFADCCVAGDKYKVVIKNAAGDKAVTIFTSSGTLNNDCSVGPYAGSSATELAGGATVVKMIAMKLPGGTPASAYVRMSNRNWRQTKGTDGCGF